MSSYSVWMCACTLVTKDGMLPEVCVSRRAPPLVACLSCCSVRCTDDGHTKVLSRSTVARQFWAYTCFTLRMQVTLECTSTTCFVYDQCTHQARECGEHKILSCAVHAAQYKASFVVPQGGTRDACRQAVKKPAVSCAAQAARASARECLAWWHTPPASWGTAAHYAA